MKPLAMIAAMPLLLAATPPPQRPPAPPVPPLFNNALPSQPPAWQQIQEPLDRSTGRITDEPTNELDRLRDYDLGRSQFDEFQLDRERQLRIDQRNGSQEKLPPPRTPQELNQREYELFLNAGLSSTALQVQADEQALLDAQSQRDQQLIAAENVREAAIKSRPGDRQQIEGDYAASAQKIRQDYEKQREKILGYAPTTQPNEK